MTRTLTRLTRRVCAAVAALTIAAAAPVAADPAHGGGGRDNTGMEQHIDANEAIADPGQHVTITQGHIDIGPLMVNGALQLLFRDDSAERPVWRRFDDAVFVLGPEAVSTIPAGHDYDFTGAQAGQQVWTVPQNQIAGVPWIGWSTQAPSLVEAVNTGVTLDFGPHDGPGEVSLFVQSGGFGGPDVIYRSDKAEPHSVFVDLHTHAHMNWVFTDPGTHRITVTATAQTRTGSTLTASAVMTFLVGDTSAATSAPVTAPVSERPAAAAVNSATASATAPTSSAPTSVPASAAPASTDAAAEPPAAAQATTDSAATHRTLWFAAALLIAAAILLAIAAMVAARRRAAAVLTDSEEQQ